MYTAIPIPNNNNFCIIKEQPVKESRANIDCYHIFPEDKIIEPLPPLCVPQAVLVSRNIRYAL